MIAQKNKPNADGKVPIFARITVGKESRVISTKLWINPDRWGNGKALGNLKEDKLKDILGSQGYLDYLDSLNRSGDRIEYTENSAIVNL